MKIATKLIALSLTSAAVVAGLVVTLGLQVKSVSTGYDKVLEGPVRQAEAAQKTQVDFKKEVQEWKDILLRGHNSTDLARYTSQFHEQDALVKAEARALAGTIEDPSIQHVLSDFLTADEQLSARYQAAYDVYVNHNFDFKAADAVVRGQDRAPTDLFDKVVSKLNDQVAGRVAAQQAQAARQRIIAFTISGALLLLTAIAGFVVVRGVVTRLGRLKQVSDRLALADIDGLSIDISGDDEVGAFGQSLKGVAAAIRELLAVATQ